MRGEMRRVLGSLDPRWVQAASREVCQNLDRIVEHDIKRPVSCILAMVRFFPGEVDLSDFISRQTARREVYLPRVSPDGIMNFVQIQEDWLDALHSGRFGIPEPELASGKTFDTAMAPLSAVIVPGLAFTDEGARLGRGKGCYDRFFARPHMMEAEKIGVCWELQVVKEVPVYPHDVSVGWICHERFGFRTERGGPGQFSNEAL